MKDYMPYVVSVILAVISSLVTYLTGRNKAKIDIQVVQESNRHEISKLMQQHQLDLTALKRKHEMDIEKLNLEHAHQLELMQKEAETKMGNDLMQSLIGEAMKTPEARQAMGAAFRNGKRK